MGNESANLRIKPVFIDFHNLKMNGSYEYPIHTHTNYEVIVIEKGPYYCNVNSKELIVDRGSFLIVKPGDRHQDHLYSGQSHYVLHFRIELNGSSIDLFNPGCKTMDQVFTIKDSWVPLKFFTAMLNDSKKENLYLKYIQDALMEEFFWRMLHCIPENLISDSFKSHTKGYIFKSNLINLFSRSYKKNLTVDDIASFLNMSRRSLSYNCQNYFADSPARLFTIYRLERAAELLIHGKLSIKEISGKLGFENQFHFSRVFSRHYRVSPSLYKGAIVKD